MSHVSAVREPVGRLLLILHGQLRVSLLLTLRQALQQKQWTLKGCLIEEKLVWFSQTLQTELRQESDRVWDGGESEVSRWNGNFGSMEGGAPIQL